MKYYVVFVGHRPGIYNSWPEAHQQVFRFSGAVYQKASSLEEATSMYQEWLSNREFTTKEGLAVGRKVDGPAVGRKVDGPAVGRKVCCESEQGSITACLWSDLGIDCVRNPVFFDWEVNEQLQKVKAKIGEMSKNPQGLLLEAIHSVGYSGALANPLLAPETALNRLNSSILEEFVPENYTTPRLVLAASGVEHEELVQYAEPLLSDLPKVARSEVPKSVYVGGDYRCQSDSQTAHVALAFEVPGCWLNEKEAMTLTVLQEQGISVLNYVIRACAEEIDLHKGKLVVKEAPRAVSERDDKLLAEHMAKLRSANEVTGDEASEEEEDTEMGDVDLDNSSVGITE